MHVVRHREEVSQVPDPEVRRVLEQRIEGLLEEYPDCELTELALFVVLEPGDPLEPLQQHLGFPVLENRFSGALYGQPAFTPSWDLLEDHGACYELVFVLGQDGYGVELFVPKAEGTAPEILEMCHRYAQPAEEPSR